MSKVEQEKVRQIFLNNMNSWISNFIIEELRTEIYEKNTKVIQNKFTGTLNNNTSAKLPRLFEPKVVEISYAHHYEDDIFKKDIFIYNLEDSDMNEIEYIIRGLKYHAKDKEEKILILISNIMTWARTPSKENKTFPEDELYEEQVYKIINDNQDMMNNSETEKFETRKNSYYYTDKDYQIRVPSNRYSNFKFIENLALSSANTNKSLIVYVICPGFIYGCGEDFFYDYFKMAWFQNPAQLPLIEDCFNTIPTIHVIDLARVVKLLIEKKPTDKYIIAIDKTKDRTLKGIIGGISSSVGSGQFSIIPFNSPEIMNFPKINELMINIKLKPSSIIDTKQAEFSTKKGFDWHCEFGIAENGSKIKAEFKEYRNLKNMKIIITGTPGCGKRTLASLLSKEFNLPHVKIANLIEYTKQLKNELGNEVRDKTNELINKQVEEAELAIAKKKLKQPQVVDRSQFTARLPDELITKIYKSYLRENICTNVGYVLDGYPRNINETKWLYFKEDSNYLLSNENQQPQQNQQNNQGKKQQNPAQSDKEKYNEEFGHLILEKDIAPFYIINIDNVTEDIIKSRLKEAFNSIEANQGLVFSEDRINRRLNQFKQQKFYVHNLLNEYGVKLINLDGKMLNHPDFLLKKATEEIEKEEKYKRNGSEIKKQEEEDFNIGDQSEIFVEGGKEDSNFNEVLNQTDKALNNKNKINTNNLKDREREILEKRSQILRLYLVENVIPILSEGILKISHNLPDDPIEELAKFLEQKAREMDLKNEEQKAENK